MTSSTDTAFAAHAAAGMQPAAGSDFYYATLYIPAPGQAEIWSLEALRRELTRIPLTCSDRGVAHIKLAWWREELERIACAQARHQIGLQLTPMFAADPALMRAFVTLINALDDGLKGLILATRAAVIASVRDAHGQIIDAIARRCGNLSPTDSARVVHLACLIELAYDLREFRQHRLGGTLHIADVALARHQLPLQFLRDATSSERLQALFKEEFTWLLAALGDAVQQTPRTLRRQQRLFITLARIQSHALKLALEDGCRVLERRLELTPIHKLMLALRARALG